MKNWIEWFLSRGYRDFGGANKSGSAKILIGGLDAVLIVFVWGYQIAFFLIVIIAFIYDVLTHWPRRKFGWPPLWDPKM